LGQDLSYNSRVKKKGWVMRKEERVGREVRVKELGIEER
jgi:hypothetical protein